MDYKQSMRNGYDQQMVWAGGEVTIITETKMKLPKVVGKKFSIWFQDQEKSIWATITPREKKPEEARLELCLITDRGI